MATGGKKETRSKLRKVGTLTLEPGDLDPWGVVVVGDKLVITDWRSDKVLVYRRHDGTFLSSSDDLESVPRGVCRVSDTEFCVVMGDASIAIMAVKISGQISRVKTFRLQPTFDDCHGVALWKDTIVVSGVKDSTTCWCVVSSQDGRPEELHKVCGGSYVSFLTVKHDMLYVSCCAVSPDDHGVYGFNLLSPRQPPYTYKPGGLTLGITVDDIGHLFVCDGSSSIHHLTATCQLVAIYKDDVPRDPWAIFWDRGVLYLASEYSHVITMYETPQQGPAIAAKATIKVDRKDQNEKSQQVFGETKALEQDIVSQKGNVSRVKLKARIPPLTPVNIVDPVEPVTQRLSEAGTAIPAKATIKVDRKDQNEKKQEARISPLRHVISVDPVKQLEQTLSETGIHESILMRLSKDLICKDWRFFFRALSVPNREIQQIEMDYHNTSVWEQIYQLLCRSNDKGILNKASILQALQMIDRLDLVTKYKKETFPGS